MPKYNFPSSGVVVELRLEMFSGSSLTFWQNKNVIYLAFSCTIMGENKGYVSGL